MSDLCICAMNSVHWELQFPADALFVCARVRQGGGGWGVAGVVSCLYVDCFTVKA